MSSHCRRLSVGRVCAQPWPCTPGCMDLFCRIMKDTRRRKLRLLLRVPSSSTRIPSARARYFLLASQFQGIVLVRRLHHFAQALNVIWAVLILLASFRRGVVQIIVSLITFPILLVFFACIIRALSEIAISVLLVPSLLVKSAGVSGRGAVNSRDEDLAAYGVTSPGDAGTIV